MSADALEGSVRENTKEISKLWASHLVLKGQTMGNGTEGHEQRIKKIEEHIENPEEHCHGLKAVRAFKEELAEAAKKKIADKDRHRSWRIGDIANLINTLLLLATIYGLFFSR